MCMSVCVSVYLPSKKSPGIRIRSSPIYYACNPPLVALRYVIQYVQYNTSLPVLWMTSCMHTQWPVIGDTNMACTQWLNRGQHGFCTPAYTQTESQGGSTGPVQSLVSTIASLLVEWSWYHDWWQISTSVRLTTVAVSMTAVTHLAHSPVAAHLAISWPPTHDTVKVSTHSTLTLLPLSLPVIKLFYTQTQKSFIAVNCKTRTVNSARFSYQVHSPPFRCICRRHGVDG